ncbi:hypothetical protein H632_c1480p0 [Helicosporidium sp. ATCC 50920]|nr:hypothetical protein H632_c1480p0 [Helicosporidium sp. ATCC 50920]|eukprot:KDD74220.1 hypothetical protein H632_c1480p0 [Helicosporidium sp. ATCC 50920]
MMGRVGRWRIPSTVFEVSVQRLDGSTETWRALGREVHVRADTDVIENLTLIHCPPERMVNVPVPVLIVGEDSCPGLKAGGRINYIQRMLPCLCRGDAVPSHFDLDISKLNIQDVLQANIVQPPPGVQLKPKAFVHPILKIMRR